MVLSSLSIRTIRVRISAGPPVTLIIPRLAVKWVLRIRREIPLYLQCDNVITSIQLTLELIVSSSADGNHKTVIITEEFFFYFILNSRINCVQSALTNFICRKCFFGTAFYSFTIVLNNLKHLLLLNFLSCEVFIEICHKCQISFCNIIYNRNSVNKRFCNFVFLRVVSFFCVQIIHKV